MTKRPAKPTSRIAKMRVASAEQKSSTVDKVRVDPRVAALVVQTYEALSPKNRKLFAQLPTKQMVATAMKLQAAKAKPAKLQKKADAGNGVVYFVIHTNDYDIEHDRDSDDPEEKERYESFMSGHEDKTDALTHAASAGEDAMLRQVGAIVKKVLPGARIGNEGHDNYGDLVCKFSVNSTEDLLKVKDAIERKFGSEGIIHSQLDSYTEATQFSFAPWDQKGPTEGLIPFSDLDEWLEDQKATTARTAKAKGKKSARTKKTASLKWDDKGQNVWVAENVEVRLSTYSGKPRSMRVPLRIDGRRGNEFRVDVGATTGWEAIDEGPTRAPKTLEDAKALAERWVSAANEQGTLSPSDYKSAKVKATVNTAASAGNSIQLFKNNKAFSHPTAPSEFKSVAEAKRWIESYDTGGTSRWVKEVARYHDGPRTSYHGGPGNAWEIRVTTGSTTAKSARKVKRATSIDYDTIVKEYAMALWASEYSYAVDQAREEGVLKRAPWSGGDNIYDYCPEMPADYINAVEQHLGSLKSSNPDIPGGAAGIEQDFLAYREATGNDEEKYGFQLSMQHQGHGVGTSDDGDFETAFDNYSLEHSSGYIEAAVDEDDTKVLYTLNARLKGSYVDFTVDATSELSYCLA